MLTLLLLLSAWEQVRNDSGFLVERRMLTGKDAGMYELRARTNTQQQPFAVFKVLWRSEDYPQFLKDIKKVEILRQGEKEKLIYQQQLVPVIANRDYTVLSRYEHDPATGLYQIFVEARPDEGPKEQPGFVRIRRTHAQWTLEPSVTGGTDITYVVASEAGGGVPQWIVNAAQKDVIVTYLQTILKRVESLAPPGK